MEHQARTYHAPLSCDRSNRRSGTEISWTPIVINLRLVSSIWMAGIGGYERFLRRNRRTYKKGREGEKVVRGIEMMRNDVWWWGRREEEETSRTAFYGNGFWWCYNTRWLLHRTSEVCSREIYKMSTLWSNLSFMCVYLGVNYTKGNVWYWNETPSSGRAESGESIASGQVTYRRWYSAQLNSSIRTNPWSSTHVAPSLSNGTTKHMRKRRCSRFRVSCAEHAQSRCTTIWIRLIFVKPRIICVSNLTGALVEHLTIKTKCLWLALLRTLVNTETTYACTWASYLELNTTTFIDMRQWQAHFFASKRGIRARTSSYSQNSGFVKERSIAWNWGAEQKLVGSVREPWGNSRV